ncbi:hypothetical protein FDP41_005760 [Naegleria fowleri]|uniref:Uncharacterized protein n=1 Tax=Naegleria fowleri TaxID=5763 RepID=A0A6A5BD64_NAEFO|nr:uncharacterized protein FDP41_005760 [Naegleria fowleri]KAF0975007.1 hypothetical protein FDP41_005760 [Naegleria fowleri]CAG4719378.1 unnamed protein product [Naegleria fowleri]
MGKNKTFNFKSEHVTPSSSSSTSSNNNNGTSNRSTTTTPSNSAPKKSNVKSFKKEYYRKKAAESTNEEDRLIQTGTGLHLDSWPYNLWGKLKSDFTYGPLDRFRPFQSMLCLTDGHENPNKKEGGLELIPGFASVAERYFPACDDKFREGKSKRIKSPWISSYHVRFNQKEEDEPLFEMVRKVKRVPPNWNAPPPSAELLQPMNADDCLDYMRKMVTEHDAIPYHPIKKGDFLYFDIRTAHRNSDANEMDRPRSVFYHAYSVAHRVNERTIETLKQKRKNFEHPDDFNSKFKMEQQVLSVEKDLIPLTPLGQCLYNERSYKTLLQPDDQIQPILNQHSRLTQRHIDFFHRYGYVVVENVVSDEECDQLLNELCHYSTQAGCPLSMNAKTVSQSDFANIGGNFGAMVEWYYLPMQQRLRQHEGLYATTVNLLANTWCATTPNAYHVPYECPFAEHLDARKLWLYVDRMNFRMPDQ